MYVNESALHLTARFTVPDSSRQGYCPAGESPAMSIARFRHVVMPQFMWVTTYSLRGVNGPAALKFQRWEQPGGLASMGA
ncbi:hypothetical protein D7D81_10200 [Halocella sp. SP3-1]|nr:hypothetical protein D7D81_10200 [Halocella sp. SP3-1]